MTRAAPIGMLRHQVALQQPTHSVDQYGEVSDSWATYRTVYARIEPRGGMEGLLADRRSASVTHTMTIRRRTDAGVIGYINRTPIVLADGGWLGTEEARAVQPGDRAVYDSRTFEITGTVDVNEDNATEEIGLREVA